MEPDDRTHEIDDNEERASSRRKFLLALGWGSLVASCAVAAFGFVRSLVPDVLFEPPSRFKADKPQDYLEGIVKLIPEEKVFIDRDANGIFAVSARCTHLGCLVDWSEDDNGYQCPCHGARFHRDGTNYAGPAPRPLPHFEVTLAKDGRLLIDKNSQVSKEYRLKA